jgi:LPS-assembly lipoprotein
MSSSDRRAVLGLLAVLPLAACGFTPVLAPGGSGQVLNGTILADAPEDRLEFAFATRIEDRLGRASAAHWALGYTIATDEVALAVSPENATSRFNVTGRLLWSIRPMGGDAPVMSGSLESFTAYSATSTTVATRSARRDAEERLMVILADQLVTQLYARAGELAQ